MLKKNRYFAAIAALAALAAWGSCTATSGAESSAAGAESSAAESSAAESSAAESSAADTDSSAADTQHTPPRPAVVTPTPEPDLIEDAEPPLVIDWDAMKAENPDIIGYLHVDGMPVISYPILYSGEDDYYLHRDLHGQESYAGSIFLEGLNTPDFADPNCLLYGHNMKDGSRFGSLKFMNSQELYDRHPYFWILTPHGDYRYKIFAMLFTSVNSEVYQVYAWHGEPFLKWQRHWQAISEIRNSVPLTTQDRTVCLTTCTSDESMRFVVFGKCVSSKKPYHSARNSETGYLADSGPSRAEAGWDEAEEIY